MRILLEQKYIMKDQMQYHYKGDTNENDFKLLIISKTTYWDFNVVNVI